MTREANRRSDSSVVCILATSQPVHVTERSHESAPRLIKDNYPHGSTGPQKLPVSHVKQKPSTDSGPKWPINIRHKGAGPSFFSFFWLHDWGHGWLGQGRRCRGGGFTVRRLWPGKRGNGWLQFWQLFDFLTWTSASARPCPLLVNGAANLLNYIVSLSVNMSVSLPPQTSKTDAEGENTLQLCLSKTPSSCFLKAKMHQQH